MSTDGHVLGVTEAGNIRWFSCNVQCRRTQSEMAARAAQLVMSDCMSAANHSVQTITPGPTCQLAHLLHDDRRKTRKVTMSGVIR